MSAAVDGSRRTFLTHLLERAGETALRFRNKVDPLKKADGTQVTAADRAAEEVLVEGLVAAFPGCGVIGEEGTLIAGRGGTFYVDPIDGTTAFLEGLAHWGPTVSLVVEGRLEAGGFHQPLTGEHWYAEHEGGAFYGTKRLESGDVDVLGPYDSLYLPSQFHHRQPLAWPGKVRALGCTAAHLALVASGGATATLVARWKLWDVGAGVLMVREAGRHIVDLTGVPFDPMGSAPVGTPFIAGAPRALERIVAYAAQARATRAT